MRKAGLVLSVIALAIAGPSFTPPAKAAESTKVVILASEQQVKQACAELPQVGVNCTPAGSALDPMQLGTGSLPMSQADYSIFDRTDRPQVRGFLVLTPLTSPGGNVYYEAVAKVFKTGFAGVGMTETALYDDQFWRNAGESLPLVTPDSERVQQFVRSLDAEAEEQKEADTKKGVFGMSGCCGVATNDPIQMFHSD